MNIDDYSLEEIVGNFHREIEQTSLGWYEVGNKVDILSPNDMDNYPQDLIVEHESIHLSTIRTSLYGSIMFFAQNVWKDASFKEYRTIVHESLFSEMLKHSIVVQEAIATYCEFLLCALQFKDHLSKARSKLPTFYSECLRHFEKLVGPISIQTNAVETVLKKDIALTLTRHVLDSPRLAEFNNYDILSAETINRYLQEDSPDERFENICKSVGESYTPRELHRVWSELILNTGKKMRLDVSLEDGLASYFLPETSREELVLEVQSKFIQKLNEEIDFKIPLVMSTNDKLEVIGRLNIFNPQPQKVMPSEIAKRVHHIHKPVSTDIISGCKKTSIMDWMATAQNIVNTGFYPVISFEFAEDKTPIITCWTIGENTPQEIGGPRYKIIEQSIGIFDLDEFSKINTKMVDQPKLMLHFQEELYKKTEAHDILLGSHSPTYLISSLEFDPICIEYEIENILKSGRKIRIRFPMFFEGDIRIVVVHGKDQQYYRSWPIVDSDIRFFLEKYSSNKNILIGNASNEGKKEFDDQDDLFTLLSISYRQ